MKNARRREKRSEKGKRRLSESKLEMSLKVGCFTERKQKSLLLGERKRKAKRASIFAEN